jgi:hypothetical protein
MMIFVFGSNLDGIHGAGAARYAREHHGAQMGVGEGLTGNSYALPTVGHSLARMPLDEVAGHIRTFLDFAAENPGLTFALTPAGCGLAGHKKRDVLAIMEKHGLPRNVYLTSTWVSE